MNLKSKKEYITMCLIEETAKIVSGKMSKESDRYDQIWSIKSSLRARGFPLHATCRETIDGVLDVLFEKYNFRS